MGTTLRAAAEVSKRMRIRLPLIITLITGDYLTDLAGSQVQDKASKVRPLSGNKPHSILRVCKHLRLLLMTTLVSVASLASAQARPMEQGTPEWWYATIMSDALGLIDFECDPAWLEQLTEVNVVCRLTFDDFPKFQQRWEANMIFGRPIANWRAVALGRLYRGYYYETDDGQVLHLAVMWDSSGLVLLTGDPYP
jgi:hypothetical protein